MMNIDLNNLKGCRYLYDPDEDSISLLNEDKSKVKVVDACITVPLRFNPQVKEVNVIVPNKVVEVTFADGTKEKSVCREPDVFSLETAISICISKKLLGGSNAYNNAIRKAIRVYNDGLKKRAAEKAEKERIEKKRAKRLAYKERKAARKREEQIAIQREAILQAMSIMKMEEK